MCLTAIEAKYRRPKFGDIELTEIDADLDTLHRLISRIYAYRRELINYHDLNRGAKQ